MPDIKVKIEPEQIVVTQDNGKNSDDSAAVDSWTCRPDQAEKMAKTWDDTNRPASVRMTRGDVSALRDASNEYQKEMKRRG